MKIIGIESASLVASTAIWEDEQLLARLFEIFKEKNADLYDFD